MLHVKSDYSNLDKEFVFEANTTIAKKYLDNEAELLREWYINQNSIPNELLNRCSNKVKEISLIGILAAVNIASRIYLQFLPNIKPVTSIIIISVMLFGLGFGVKLSVVTTVVSNLFLGMGTWTFFQILAWVVICLITQVLLDFLKKIHKEPKLFPMAIFSFFMGYVFGIVVSLEQLMLGGPSLYIVYYMAGLLFDTFHAVGNFCFYLICAPILMKVLKKESERIRLKQD